MTKQTNAKTSKKGGKTMDGLKQQQLHYNWKQKGNIQKGMHYQLLDNVQLEQVRAMLTPHQLLILNKVWNIIDQFDRYIYHHLNKKAQTVGKVYKYKQLTKEQLDKAKERAESYACDKAYEYWEQLDTLERQDPAEQQAHIEVYNEAFHEKYLELITK